MSEAPDTFHFSKSTDFRKRKVSGPLISNRAENRLFLKVQKSERTAMDWPEFIRPLSPGRSAPELRPWWEAQEWRLSESYKSPRTH